MCNTPLQAVSKIPLTSFINFPFYFSGFCVFSHLRLRQAGTWDPLLQSCSTWTWTHLSSSNKMQRNCMGLQITVCMRRWYKFWTQKIQRDQKPNCHIWRALSKNRVLHKPPAHTTTYRVDKTPKPPLWPDRWTHPYPHSAQDTGLPSPPSGRKQAREPVVRSCCFPGGSEVKASAWNAGDLGPGSISRWGRSPGEGNGNPLQYSCLENPMDWGAWWAIVHRVAKSQTQLSDFTLTT